MPDVPIILASTSPARIALLRASGIACRPVAPRVDEAAIHADTPEELAWERALAKAHAIEAPDAIVIGADQVAHFRGEAFGKPTDPADHRARLRQLRGETHTLTTAVCVRYNALTSRVQCDSRVTFRADLTDAELDAYVGTAEGSGCAGGYAVEGLGAHLVERIDGDYHGVLGLPLYPLISALRAFGWRPTFPPAAS